MKIVVFDTETISIDKPFCYNIGYIIADTETGEILQKRDFVCEQVWHNPMLFTTAYYADKKEIYISRMKSQKVIMDKYGYICQKMIRDFHNFGVEKAFAYNSNFDERVFNFNCDWFKCNNPFDNIPIADIRGFAHHFIVDDEYKRFCENSGLFTESYNYSTTAETMFRFISNELDFEEEHTALADSEIELQILMRCIEKGADINELYHAKQSIPREMPKKLKVTENGVEVFSLDYFSCIISKKKEQTIIRCK